ncbi:thioredoxin-dependent thiol peroxidase [soil metagenome]
MENLQKGDQAPAFTLDSNRGEQSLAGHRGEWLVLYFYPKDDTPGCTAEACDFRDLGPSMPAKVLGVSGDDVDSHNRFAEAYALNFPLLFDRDHRGARAYGAYGEKTTVGTMVGTKRAGVIRSTFIIGPTGEIEEAMYDVKAQGHGQKVADRLQELQAVYNT